MRYAAFIFARGGSKGLPGKNIRELRGKPLIGWAIEQVLAARGIDRVIVSTDSEEIAAVARAYGASVPFLRPEQLARDDSPEWLAWRHALTFVNDLDGVMPDALLSVPATAPLRLTSDIEACLDAYEAGDCEVVITVSPARRNPYFNMVKANPDGTVGLVIPPQAQVTRRQDAPEVFDIATVAYVANVGYVMTEMSLFAARTRAVRVPPERAVDIDDIHDFRIAEALLDARATERR